MARGFCRYARHEWKLQLSSRSLVIAGSGEIDAHRAAHRYSRGSYCCVKFSSPEGFTFEVVALGFARLAVSEDLRQVERSLVRLAVWILALALFPLCFGFGWKLSA